MEPDVRFLLANERTFLAWQRTAVGLVAAALAVLHLFEPTPTMKGLGLLLLATAVLAAVGGWLRYRRADAAIRAGVSFDRHRTLDVFVVLVLAGIAVAALSVAL